MDMASFEKLVIPYDPTPEFSEVTPYLGRLGQSVEGAGKRRIFASARISGISQSSLPGRLPRAVRISGSATASRTKRSDSLHDSSDIIFLDESKGYLIDKVRPNWITTPRNR